MVKFDPKPKLFEKDLIRVIKVHMRYELEKSSSTFTQNEIMEIRGEYHRWITETLHNISLGHILVVYKIG